MANEYTIEVRDLATNTVLKQYKKFTPKKYITKFVNDNANSYAVDLETGVVLCTSESTVVPAEEVEEEIVTEEVNDEVAGEEPVKETAEIAADVPTEEPCNIHPHVASIEAEALPRTFIGRLIRRLLLLFSK